MDRELIMGWYGEGEGRIRGAGWAEGGGEKKGEGALEAKGGRGCMGDMNQ